MNIELLYHCLKGEHGWRELKDQIRTEIKKYHEQLGQRGAVCPVIVENIPPGLSDISKNDIRALLNGFIRGELSQYELNYISEALALAFLPTGLDPEVEDALVRIADDAQTFTKQDAVELIRAFD